MYRADSTKSSVELPELCFDGMNISCHQFNDIDTLPCILTNKVFSGQLESCGNIYFIGVFIVGLSFLTAVFIGGFICKKDTEVIQDQICIDFLNVIQIKREWKVSDKIFISIFRSFDFYNTKLQIMKMTTGQELLKVGNHFVRVHIVVILIKIAGRCYKSIKLCVDLKLEMKLKRLRIRLIARNGRKHY